MSEQQNTDINLIKEFGTNYFKNRTRFTQIISDKRFSFLESVLERLEKKDESLTDEEILKNYLLFSNSMQSNSFAITELETVIAAALCAHRPHLADRLLERAMLAFIASVGDEIDSSHYLHFVNNYLLKAEHEPYGGYPPREGIIWLKSLNEQAVLVQRVLERMIIENKKELGEL